MNKTVLALLVATVAPLTAQGMPLRFEVASIKPMDPANRGVAGPTGFLPGGRYVMRTTGDRLLLMAFREGGAATNLRPEQIVGAPSWLGSTLYSIEAKVAGPPTAEPIVDPQAARLLRSLLEDRFKLKSHYEQRELPFYALLLAKPDGSFGPNLSPSSFDCEAINREREAARLANRPAVIPEPVAGRSAVCTLGLGRTRIFGTTAMTGLAIALTSAVGSTVLDRTGRPGQFDIELHFSPDSPGAAPAAANTDAPSVFTAVREQLGLKLEMRREMRPVLVIDHVEPPKPD